MLKSTWLFSFRSSCTLAWLLFLSATLSATSGWSVEHAFNFQPASAPVPSGFVFDSGAAFSETTGHGWIREDSLGLSSVVPLDITPNTRDREGAGITQEYDTLIHLAYPSSAPNLTSVRTRAAWELIVPNGLWQVTVAVGDYANYDSVHVIRIEGATVINGFVGSPANKFLTVTSEVIVRDGKLTIDSLGGTNTKLCWLRATSVMIEPPAPVTDLTASADETSVALSWTPIADVIAYRLHRSTTLPVDTSAGVSVDPSGYLDAGLSLATTYHYVIETINAGDLHTFSAPLSVSTAAPQPPVMRRISFQPAPSALPDGYEADIGAAFSDVSGSGWVRQDSLTSDDHLPLDLTLNTRDRNSANVEQRLDTFIHMQHSKARPSNGIRIPAAWEVIVPAGIYTVTVAVGDKYTDSRHVVRVEGVVAIDNFVPSVSELYRVATVNVVVNDGRMTVDAIGGINTKLCFIDITQIVAESPAVTAPSNLIAGASDNSVHLTWNIADATGIESFAVYRSTVETIDTSLPPVATVPVGTTSMIDGGLLPSVTYHYLVRSLGYAGGRADSAPLAVTTGQHPMIVDPDPLPNASNVPRNVAITCGVMLVNPGGVDSATLISDIEAPTIFLERVLDGALVPGVANTSGGRDSIVFTPSDLLSVNTKYRFVVTAGVRDEFGASFEPFSLVFTTGTESSIPSDPRVGFDASTVYDGGVVTSLNIGPDGRLYGAGLDGVLRRWSISSDGTLGPVEVNNTFAGKVLVGIVFDVLDPTVLWLTVNESLVAPAPQFSSRVVRAVIDNSNGFSLQAQDYIIGLPRSARDHLSNSLAFGPDGFLYLSIGSNSATGAPDGPWYYRNETLLSGAILRIDPHRTTDLPVNVRTQAEPVTEGVPYVGYDPHLPDAPLSLYAFGIRNAYDLLWHSNGQLYSAANGSAAGGNTPVSPMGIEPAIPGLIRVGVQDDFLFRIEKGGYYGHPNPLQGTYVLNGGNPTEDQDPAEVIPTSIYSGYPVGTLPEANYRGYSYNFGRSRSPNGTIEYRSQLFAGALTNRLLVAEYSGGDDIIALLPDQDGNIIDDATIRVVGGLNDPLDLIEDRRNGNLYVSELFSNGISGRVTLLRPARSTGIAEIAVSTEPVFFGNQVINTVSNPIPLLISNTGGATLVIPQGGMSLSGVDADCFQFSTPNAEIIIPVGSSQVIELSALPIRTGVLNATVQIASNDPYHNRVDVSLVALGTLGTGGSKEPSLQWILSALGQDIDVGDDDPSTNAMPLEFPLGDELGVQSFVQASTEPVTIEPLAVFGPASDGIATTCGWYWAGSPTGIHDLFTVDAANAQRVMPAFSGVTSFTPGPAPFSFYSRWPYFKNRMIFGEDALNTFDTDVPHHVRTYALRDADGVVVPNAFILAFEEHIIGRDWQDLVMIVRGIKPAEVTNGTLMVQNQDVVPFSDRLVFSRIGALNPAPTNGVHDLVTLRLSNTGSGPLVISETRITGPWQLESSSSLPLVLSPSAYVDLQVRFIADKPPRLNLGSLSIYSSDALNPLKTVELAGFWQSVSEGGQEPTVAEVVEVFGYNVTITRPGEMLNGKGAVQAIGDEILSAYWRRADLSKPVTSRQLAALHTYPKTANLRWFLKGMTAFNTVFSHLDEDGQSLLPRHNNGTPGLVSFTPTVPVFGLAVDVERSDWLLNNATLDLKGGAPPPAGHHVRFWPVRDRSGVLIPNTWLMVMDYASINYDYNDNMYLISNIKPENASLDPSAPAPFPGDPPVVLEFNKTIPGSVVDLNGQGTGFFMTQPDKTDRPGAITSYRPELLVLDAAVSGTLAVTTASGDNVESLATQVNSLRVPFNANVIPFRISTTIAGPLPFTQAGQRLAIMLDFDRDTFVSLSVGVPSTGGAPVLKFTSETNQKQTAHGKSVAVPANLTALTLILTGDPDSGLVTASYQVHTAAGIGVETDLTTVATLTGPTRQRLFSARSWATVLANHGSALSSATVVLDRFAVERETPELPTGVALIMDSQDSSTP